MSPASLQPGSQTHSPGRGAVPTDLTSSPILVPGPCLRGGVARGAPGSPLRRPPPHVTLGSANGWGCNVTHCQVPNRVRNSRMRGAQSPEVPLPPTVWPRPLSRRACTVGGSWGVRAPHCGLHGLPSRNRASPWAVTTSLSCPALGDNTACCPGSSTCHPDRPRIAGQEAATGRPRGGFSHGTVHGQVPSVDRACAQQGPDTTQQRGLVRTPSHRSDTCHPSPLGLPEVPLPHAPGGSWLPGAGGAGLHPSGRRDVVDGAPPAEGRGVRGGRARWVHPQDQRWGHRPTHRGRTRRCFVEQKAHRAPQARSRTRTRRFPGWCRHAGARPRRRVPDVALSVVTLWVWETGRDGTARRRRWGSRP